MTQKEAVDILAYISSHSCNISEELYFTIIDGKYNEVITKLGEMCIEYENMGDTTIKINVDDFKKLEIEPFCSADSFFRKYHETSFLLMVLGNKDIDTLVSITNDNYKYMQHFQRGIVDNTSTNFLYLKKIIKLLSQPRVTDYYDTAHNRFFFLSPECGKLELYEGDINSLVNISKSNMNLYDTYTKFNTMFDYPKGWEYILKNKIIRGLENINIKEEGFKELIFNLSKFIDATEKDYELFLTSRKHESIVQQFENEKYLFADKIRSILQRISGSIVSIPLAFFSASFAMREINELWQLNIVVLALLIYTIFSIIVNFLFLGDLDILKEEITTKKKNLSMEVSRLDKDLTQIANPFFSRINFLKILVVISMVLFALIFLFFVFMYTSNNRQAVNIC